MLVRYKQWFEDSLNAHTVSYGLGQLVFLDADEGVLDVRDKASLEFLIRHPSKQYELAYDRYGVFFDAEGQQLDPADPVPASSLEPEERKNHAPPAPKRGRAKK